MFNQESAARGQDPFGTLVQPGKRGVNSSRGRVRLVPTTASRPPCKPVPWLPGKVRVAAGLGGTDCTDPSALMGWCATYRTRGTRTTRRLGLLSPEVHYLLMATPYDVIRFARSYPVGSLWP